MSDITTLTANTDPQPDDMLYIVQGGTSYSTRVKYLSASGATGSRPASPPEGYEYFDTTLGKPVWYSGGSWYDEGGTSV